MPRLTLAKLSPREGYSSPSEIVWNVVVPGLHDRLGLSLGRPRGTRGSKVLASFTGNLEKRSARHVIFRHPVRNVSRVEGPTPFPASIDRLLYQMRSAGQLPRAPRVVPRRTGRGSTRSAIQATMLDHSCRRTRYAARVGW